MLGIIQCQVKNTTSHFIYFGSVTPWPISFKRLDIQLIVIYTVFNSLNHNKLRSDVIFFSVGEGKNERLIIRPKESLTFVSLYPNKLSAQCKTLKETVTYRLRASKRYAVCLHMMNYTNYLRNIFLPSGSENYSENPVRVFAEFLKNRKSKCCRLSASSFRTANRIPSC